MNKILIADDNQQITSILANYARKEGFEPLVALDGQQALELFEQHEKNIDVVLLDVTLTKKEVELLWTLAKNSSKVFSRENLLDSIWGYDYFGDSRTVDSHIKRLRAKVDKFEHEEWEIKTIWGVGYRFEEKEHAQ